jgi:hypothetical protein
MRIYLDDTRPTPEGFTHRCYLPNEVIDLLKQAELDGIRVEQVALDHDLGFEDRGPNGYNVLEWIEEQVYTRGYCPPQHITIHTDNASARDKMMAARKQIYKAATERGIDWR